MSVNHSRSASEHLEPPRKSVEVEEDDTGALETGMEWNIPEHVPTFFTFSLSLSFSSAEKR